VTHWGGRIPWKSTYETPGSQTWGRFRTSCPIPEEPLQWPSAKQIESSEQALIDVLAAGLLPRVLNPLVLRAVQEEGRAVTSLRQEAVGSCLAPPIFVYCARMSMGLLLTRELTSGCVGV